MDARERVDRFDFNDDGIGNDQVQPEPRIEFYALIDEGRFDLPANADVSQAQFVHETLLVYLFEKARAEGPVNLERRIHEYP